MPHASWGRIIKNNAQTFGAKVALSSSSQKISYTDLENQVQEQKRRLLQLGLNPGDLLVIWGLRTPRTALAYLSALSMDLVPLVLFERSPWAPIRSMLGQVKPRAILTAFEIPGLEVDPVPFFSQRLYLLKQNANPSRAAQLREIGGGTVLGTSGSSGQQKLVVISRQDLYARAMAEKNLFSLEKNSQILNFLTLSHDLGLNQLLSCMLAGATLHMENFLFPTDFFRLALNLEITGITGVPFLWRQVLGVRMPHPLPKLRYLSVSGESLNSSELASLTQAFPRAKIFKTYGQTETFRSIAGLVDPRKPATLAAIGRKMPGVSLKLIKGILHHSGTGVHLGLLSGTGKFQKKRGLWVCTGDSFTKRGGLYFFRGRRGSLVKIKGFRVSLLEIELVLSSFPGVRGALTLARGGRIEARVEADSGISPLALRAHCLKHLQQYACPSSIEVLPQLARTSTGKIKRMKFSC